jgi:hypothetical protein
MPVDIFMPYFSNMHFDIIISPIARCLKWFLSIAYCVQFLTWRSDFFNTCHMMCSVESRSGGQAKQKGTQCLPVTLLLDLTFRFATDDASSFYNCMWDLRFLQQCMWRWLSSEIFRDLRPCSLTGINQQTAWYHIPVYRNLLLFFKFALSSDINL